MKFFDVCTFLGPWPYSGYGLEDPRHIVAELDTHQIDKSALSSTQAIFGDVDAANDAILKASHQFPRRLLPVYTTFPHQLLNASKLQRWVADGCVAVRLWPQHHAYRLIDPSSQRLMEMIKDTGLPLFVSIRVIMNWGLPELSIDDIATASALHPKLKIVVGGFNYAELPRIVDLANQQSNIFLEISCLQMRDPLETLVRLVEPSRIMLGTGLPLQYARCGLVKVRQTELAPETVQAVCYVNAQRLSLSDDEVTRGILENRRKSF